MIIPIYKDQIPYQFDLELGAMIYTFELQYNADYDFFTIDCLLNDEVIVYGEKLVLNKPLFANLSNRLLPQELITPVDASNTEARITFTNLGETIQLQVGDVDAV